MRLIERMKHQGLYAKLQSLFTAPTLAKLAAAIESGQNPDIVVSEAIPDFDHEATLDPDIVLRTEGTPSELQNAFLTGASGFLGAFLLSELLVETRAHVYCLVRSESSEAGHRKIMQRLTSFGLWDSAFSDRIVPVLGDLTKPLLGLSHNKFEELAKTTDLIYHCGAAVNFYYPYHMLKSANVRSTEELLRMASVGRSKSLHFVSTLTVATAQQREGSRSIFVGNNPYLDWESQSDGYTQSKRVAEKLVSVAAVRGIPVVTYRPAIIIGHPQTGSSNLEDFFPSFIRGCMELGYVPDLDREIHLVPIDYVSRSIVAISKRQECFGHVLNLTSQRPSRLREVLDHLLTFDRTLRRVSYEKWRSLLAGDPNNLLARYIGSFPERMPENEERTEQLQFDCGETLGDVEAAGIGRPQITQQLLQTYFAYIAKHSVSGARVGAD